jgi:hypothetical protein
MSLTPTRLSETIARLDEWVEAHEYRGYEPFDGLSSWLRPLTLRRELPQRMLQQLVRQSPFNLRPLLGITPKDSTKGRGYMAWGYLLRYRTHGRSEDLRRATACLDWLDHHKARRYAQHSWANHFDFVARGGGYTSEDPIIVWTSLIGHAYVEAFQTTGEARFLRIAMSACDWILALPRERSATGDCLSYLADRQLSIHNANMLGAALLARTARHCANRTYLEVARAAMEYSCSRQHADGAWWYGEEAKYHWIDGFHTGYNLDSLAYYVEATGQRDLEGHLARGLEYYRTHLFENDGTPKYYHDRTHPVDIQCAAQAIDTLATFGRRDPACLALATQVAEWTLDHMLDRRGYFHYRKYPLLTARTPMLHWGQATMFKALSNLEYSTQQLAQRAIEKPAAQPVASTSLSKLAGRAEPVSQRAGTERTAQSRQMPRKC